jgi:pimeloyl-ACP methyl ester carboxylesterase
MAAFFAELARFSRLILFDRRGVGLSDRVGSPPTLEDTMDDILAVMKAAGSKHAVLFGVIEGGPTSVLFAATYPDRVSGLILYATNAKLTRSADYPWAITREQYDRWLEYIVENWGKPVNLEVFAPSRAHEPQLREWWAKYLQLASSPGGMKAVLEVMRDIDVRDVLPAIRTPTLVLHRKDDKAMRVGAGRYLAGQIPGAKYVELEGQDTWWFVGDSRPILREMKTFVKDLGSPVVPERVLATILLIEVLDSNKSPNRDDPETILSDPTYVYIHQEVSRFRGSEVNWNESRYVATFDGPSRAIHCAKAILGLTSRSETKIRAGLHTGECEFIKGELVGTAFEIVEFVQNTAGPNEVLVSNTVKDLVVGAGFRFEARGEHSIDGVSGKWKLYLVE